MRGILKYVLILFILLQIPFVWALYETSQVQHYLSSIPRRQGPQVPFQDLRGAIHVHSAAGGHSLGTYPEILKAGREAGLDYIFITEHPRPQPLLARIDDPEIVVVYGFEEEEDNGNRILRDENDRLRILAEAPDEIIPSDVQGMEIYNIHANAARSDSWLNRIRFLYHQAYHPELFFLHLWQIDYERIAVWETTLNQRHISATAGNDAHQNVGIVVETASGQKLLTLMVDPYLYSFRFVTTHVLLKPGEHSSSEAILSALRSGAAYIAFERIADSSGFAFYAIEDGRTFPMGSRVKEGAHLLFQAPFPVRFVLRRSGAVYRELEGRQFLLVTDQSGIYRLEAYLLRPPRLLEDRPWILSNPIYVGESESATGMLSN